MMMSLYLSRVSISRDASALRALIDPHAATHPQLQDFIQGRAMDAHHRLIWTLFSDSPDRQRDFLWRADGNGKFLVLSPRRPENRLGLFDAPEIKEFEPILKNGDTLDFLMRVNATIAKPDPSKPQSRGKRVDIVMDALKLVHPGEERRIARMAIASEVGQDWIVRQGAKSGFTVEHCEVSDYSVVPLPNYRGKRSKLAQFGVMNILGRITVVEPELLVNKIAEGFGQAKAFGCGLMLIRRS